MSTSNARPCGGDAGLDTLPRCRCRGLVDRLVESVAAAVVMVVEILVHAVEMPILMPSHAVAATVLIPVHAVESVLPTTDTL